MFEHGLDDANVLGSGLHSGGVLVKKLLAVMEAQLNEQKRKNQQLVDDMMKMREALEAQIAEGKIHMEELKKELDERRKKDVEVRDFAVASCSVALTLAAVLFSICAKRS